MDKDTIARLRGLLEKARVKPLSLGGNPNRYRADELAHERLIAALQREALNALPALLSIAERAADVEGIYGAVNMTPGVAWLKTDEQKAVATAVSRYVLGGE